jgi:hypothetical protein
MKQPNVLTASQKNKRTNNYHQSYYSPQKHQKRLHQENHNLNALEKYTFNKTFRHESDLARLERLENLAFGSTQIGNLASRYANVEQAILSRPKYNTKNSILGNIANYFIGNPTGFTPNLDNYFYNSNTGLPAGFGFSNSAGNFYPAPIQMNQNFEHYSNSPFSNSWGLSNQNYGNGSSIRILD